MARLDAYRAKRDPDATPEPFDAGRPSAGALRYSMQNHDATRLHWDLRLEWDGVLLSWAVTRGPSFDPAEKRLAVRTEDHPLPYLTFEGVIPPRQYGAGTVMLWDVGHWRPVGDAQHGLDKGHLRFQLYGRRLTGLWDLVRLRGRAEDRKRENWLLVKAEDEAAHRPDPVERYRSSVSTRRDFAGIAASGDPPVEDAALLPRPAVPSPMLAKLTDTAPVGADWLHEVKLDGYRGMVALGQGGPRILTRNGLDWTDRFAPLVPALAELPARSALLDGEIVAGAGLTGFEALQQAIKDGGPFAYVAFDLLSRDGQDLTRKPLTDRRAALAEVLADVPPLGLVQMSAAIPGDGAAALAAICAAGGEGIVSKRAGSPYRPGRGDSWRKVKCERRDDFVVVGWIPSESAGRPFGSLMLAAWQGDGLVYRGKVGTGFDGAAQADIAARLRPLGRSTPPVAVPRAEARGARWVEPRLVGEVRYTELTADGHLRHPSWQGLREDKMPDPEHPVAAEKRSGAASPAHPRRASVAAAAPAAVVRPGRGDTATVAGVTISSADRMVYPAAGVTKGDVARWYDAAAPRMLEFAANRPLSLVRLPSGIEGERFFQKHAGKGFPAAIRTVDVGDDEPAMVVRDARGLVAAAQMGTIEVHIRGAHADRPDRPDRIVFDFDPDEAVGFADVRAAATELRDRLADLGLPSWPLVTGGKGIHVVTDIKRTVEWATVTLFARTIATMMAAESPDRFVAVMSRARRSGRIFVDWLRNEPQATAICPYSLRAREGATVAMPVTWQTLDGLKGADAFSLRDPSLLEAAQPERPAPVALGPAVRALTGGTRKRG